ncbi:MAG: DHH family phosphoesterase, partial [Candidatus Peribacteraceae bacterium]|nr:DHH family phosphoesterase [Candidatus Peribacteraceae bacterium]
MKAKVKYAAEGTKELMRNLRGLSGTDSESTEDGWEPENYAVANFPDLMEASYRLLTHEVLIHGDYDADGLCATAIAKLGIPGAEIYIPSREDGYGLTSESLLELSEDKLVLTVDCGISNLDDMQDAESELGRKFIVTDHHEPPVANRVHAFPVVNPKAYDIGYNGLSGSGVAFFFLRQLAMQGNSAHTIQLAAIGTMSDMMPVLQWNRPLIRTAVQSMKDNPCPAVKAMAKVCNINLRYITEETLSWYFGPILNSAGRRGNLYAAAEMLYTEDEDRAYEIAKFLKKDKDKEKKELIKAAKDIKKKAPTMFFDGIVVVNGSNIPNISTGATANHVLHESGLPALVYGLRDNLCVASIRCSDTFDAPALIAGLVDMGYALDGGGHKGAAGLQWTP